VPHDALTERAGPLFGGVTWPLGCGVGFVERPLRDVLKANESWARGLGRRWAPRSLGNRPLYDQLLALAPLQMPSRRQIIVGTTGRWTMHANNSRIGGDSGGWVGAMSKRLGCRGVSAHHIPVDQYPYPSTQLELFGPDGKPPLGYVRTISAGIYDEGHWKFLVSGEGQPFEEVQRYGERRIGDRFNREVLIRYLGALGIRADDSGFFTTATLLEERESEHQWSATLEEARAERTHPWPRPAKVSRENRGGVIARVDDRRIYPGFIGFAEQPVASAGGHRYSLELVAPANGKLPDELRNLSSAEPGLDARRILNSVARAMETYGYQNAAHEYVMNTVDQASGDERTISIAGVCSPVSA
jgi:hypothetical protein